MNNTMQNTSYGQFNQNSMFPGSGHTMEDAHIEEKKSLDALNKFISILNYNLFNLNETCINKDYIL